MHPRCKLVYSDNSLDVMTFYIVGSFQTMGPSELLTCKPALVLSFFFLEFYFLDATQYSLSSTFNYYCNFSLHFQFTKPLVAQIAYLIKT